MKPVAWFVAGLIVGTLALGGARAQFASIDETITNRPRALLLQSKDQAFSGGVNVTTTALATGSVIIDCGLSPLQSISNGGAYTITAPANDGSCILLSTNNGSAGAITFSGFSVGAATGDALDTTNGHKFSIHIWRVNGVSGYRVAAHQ